MGDTGISGIGKILSAKETLVTGAAGTEKEAKVNFAEMMDRAGLQTAEKFSTQNTTDNSESVLTVTVADVTEDYEKYQYKEKLIQNKENCKEITSEKEVVEERANEFAEDVNEVLQEEFGVTEEEIAKAMEALGLQYVDLLNPGNLAQLVARLTGQNVNQLLCNEQFVTALQDVSVLGQELLQELNMTAMEVQATLENNPAEKIELPVEPEELALMDAGEKATASAQMTEGEKTKGIENTQNAEKEADATSMQEDVDGEAVQKVTAQNTDANAGEETDEQTQMLEQPVENASEDEKANGAKIGKTNVTLTSNEPTQGIVNANSNSVISHLGETQTIQELPSYVTVRDIIDQMVNATRVTLTDGMAKMEMQLNPENLGKMYIEIVQKEGSITAKIQLQNALVKEAVEAQMADLKQTMNQAGVKVDAVEVTVASHEFERNLEQDARQQEQQAEQQEKATKQRRINLNSLDELSGVMSEEETLVAQMMSEQGNSVDFTA